MAVLALVVAVEVLAVVVFGSITAVRYPLWSIVDEGAHFDNIAYIAEHGSLPVLGKTLANEQVLAIAQGVYPRHTTIDPRTDGLGGLSYEAFQPPLYYLVATPVYFLSGNYHTKAILLRFFGLFLLLVAIALLARLSRLVLRERWLAGLAGGLLVLLMPGFVVRMVTISNMALAVPILIATVTELWIAWQRASPRRLVAAGILVGCSVLTDLYLAELVPVLLAVTISILVRRRTRRDVMWSATGGALAALLVLPWVVFNEVEYGALTAGNLVKAEQTPIINPDHLRHTVSQLPGLTVQNLFHPLMPQEWGAALASHALLSYLASTFEVLLVPAALVLALALGRRLFTTGYWILILPWLGNVVICWYVQIGQQWQGLVARYTYPSLAVLGLFVVAAALSFTRSVKPVVATIATSTLFLVGLWVHLLPAIRTS